MRQEQTSASRRGRQALLVLASLLMVVGLLPAAASAQTDPRVGLTPGYNDAGQAASGLEHIGRFRKQDGGLINPTDLGSFAFAGSDISFTGDHVIAGNFAGFQIHDISDPENPTLRTEVLCPGGQGDTTVYGNLLFFSAEEARGRIDCGTTNPTSEERFRGIRIFDISDLDNPVQVATVQTCRGSHTHRLVEDPNDSENVYIYVNGTGGVRSDTELAGCANPSKDAPDFNTTSSRFLTEIIKVPVAAPQNAAIVNRARLFANPETGRVDGLWPGGNHGPGTQSTSETDACHDITAYPEIGLAAGACEGNGILIDISDPANPVRIDAVLDPNFAYWHSANFNNDGTKVMFTDEWGGGTGARCRPTDPLSWGANALFDIVEVDGVKQLELASYYKMPAPQTSQENCVAHQANILPVPGRDIIVQGWYQGGISVFDWTDTANPVEIAYFDRGPINNRALDGSRPTSASVLGGFWSGYWYNGNVYGAEIARGLDAFEVLPSEFLTQNEIDAAKTVQLDEHNAMAMRMYEWEPSFPLARATVDQVVRAAGMTGGLEGKIRNALQKAEEWLAIPGKEIVALSHFDRAVHLLLWQADVIEDKGKDQGDADALRALADTILELKSAS